jgi:hypothetical protein
MLRMAAVVAVALICLCGPARAGVLSATDTQHMRDYAQFVVPADREMPALHEMAARVERLMAMANSSDEAADGSARVDFQSAVLDFPRAGGAALEMMVSLIQAVGDPDAFAPREWVAMLTEIRAETEERLAYDADLLKAFQRSLAPGASPLEERLARWEERPDAGVHWSRFQRIFNRAPGF